jgi:hypothetical protein
MKVSTASRFAYIAVVFIAVGLGASIALRPPEEFAEAPLLSVVVTTTAFLLFNLAMLPVIAALPSPAWARTSGFAWVVVDNVLELMSLFDEGADLIIPMRWGIHLATATWILGASWAQRGALRWVGVIVALALTAVSLAGPFIADRAAVVQSLGPAALLFIVWIVIAGVRLGRPPELSATGMIGKTAE